MEVQLRRLGPNSKIKILKVPKDCRTKIWLAGRGTSCQIYTKSIFASRQHFSITYKEQKYFISDLQSANGTFVNNEKLVGEKQLTLGSIISVGVPPEMQNSPDCIVYVFELHTDGTQQKNQANLPKNGKICTQYKTKENCAAEPVNRLQNEEEMDVDPQLEPLNVEPVNEFVNDVSVDVEKTVLNNLNDSSSDIVLIEPSDEMDKHSQDSIKNVKPAKKRKLDQGLDPNSLEPKQCVSEQNFVPAIEKNKIKAEESEFVQEDLMAYEALTQVDEIQVKTEPDLLNYSLTEELIEISDSEDDWTSNLKQEESKCFEGAYEDDDVVFLQTIVKTKEPNKVDVPPIVCKIEDDLTETDKKWMGKLLKIKNEIEYPGDSQEVEQIALDDTEEKTAVEETMSSGPSSTEKEDESTIVPCAVRLSRLSTKDVEDQIPDTSGNTFPNVEIPRTTVKRVLAKKSVSFDFVPQIKYFEVSSRSRLTPSEKGRLRFNRIIYNICNWNTHWLEECKRVAPDKDPPDICEEKMRKIPKKFPCHADYMIAFIPAMLLHLWNKVKDKWVESGESGFRQTVSCDSYEEYHTENLYAYKCTGLVQNVDAHKVLLREGHLVLMRLHQIQNPDYVTPASVKYSKKLGYLVFGFVEGKTYERFYDQPLHQSLAERCTSIVGDLHIVRLTILAKKRPNFQIDKQKLIQLTVIHQISSELRMFRGICLLPDSPLCAFILKPTKFEYPLVEPLKKEKIIFKGSIDDTQKEILRKLSHTCFSTDSFLYSIHGAAGTGKSQFVIALILQLLFGEEWKGKRPKVIYCTQWSIPVDEMLMKLKIQRQILGEHFNLVRIGPVREVKPKLRDLCLANLAANLRGYDKRDGGRNFDAEVEIIKEADVICTTCISAGLGKMCVAFEKLLTKDKNRKIICIIDEAMSSTERDSVIPLLLGVTHLILVGDTYLMEPSFSGEKTHSLGLDMSLFWRIYKNYANIPKELWPIFILKTQYRMTYGLSKFTSQLIYNTSLQNPAVNIPNKLENIKCFQLFTYDGFPEGEKDIHEAKIAYCLTKAVTRTVKTAGKNSFRLAVISCDAKQMESLQVLMPKREFPEIEIDLIQGCQGREFDVVVFIYDGRKILTSWLATALTRAKCSLFVCASQQSIKGNSFVRKMSDKAEKLNYLKYVHSEMGVEEFEKLIAAI